MTEPHKVPVRRIGSPSQLPELASAIADASRVAVDTETHDARVVDGMWVALRVVSVATRAKDGTLQSFVIDFRDVPAEALAPVLGMIMEADAWNANFDDRVCRINGVPVAKWRDAMLTDALLHAGIDGFDFWHGLAKVAKRLLGVTLGGKGTTQTSFDADSDLTDEQVRYAGLDAVVTLLVAEKLDALVESAGITDAVSLDQAARPFIASMMENGFPFDVEGWRGYLGNYETRKAKALREIASLTGGAEVTLFGTSEGPSWNVESDPETRLAFNTWAKDLVKAFTGGEPLGKTHKLDKTALKQMIQMADASGSDALVQQAKLCKAVLEYRSSAKVISTYGDNLTKFIDADGRIHARYKQGVVATGRLASDKPNAQNLAPATKSFIAPRPSADGRERVFVYADLSQAELRVLAHLSGERRMIEMFEAGGDFHALTAGQMFSVDMDALKSTDAEAHATYRKKAKGVNFGIPYGLGAAALATNLTVNSGVKTEMDEAQALLNTYARTYVNVDAWLKNRDSYVRGLASNPPAADWSASLRLYDLWVAGETKRKAFKRQRGYEATGLELSNEILTDQELSTRTAATLGRTPTEEELQSARLHHAGELEWAFSFDAPVVLTTAGVPLAFESRTVSGRRRLFTVPMDSSSSTDKFTGVLTAAMLIAATTDKPGPAKLRDEFAAEYTLDLPSGTDRCSRLQGENDRAYRRRANEHRKTERTRCVKAFEGTNKPLKYVFVKKMMAAAGPEGAAWLLNQALGDQIRGKGNAFRNAPIQGSVGDIVLGAFAKIWDVLLQYDAAFPVQSVHDSVVIECYLEDAAAIAEKVKDALESSMAQFCATVPAKADCDVRRSLSDDSVLTDDELDSLSSTHALT